MEQEITIKWQQKISLGLIILLLLETLFILVSFSELNNYIFGRKCSSFSSQKDAQKFLKKYPSLDKDNDGIACNELK